MKKRINIIVSDIREVVEILKNLFYSLNYILFGVFTLSDKKAPEDLSKMIGMHTERDNPKKKSPKTKAEAWAMYLEIGGPVNPDITPKNITWRGETLE